MCDGLLLITHGRRVAELQWKESGYSENQCMGDLLELVQVALTTPSLSTLLSVVLPQCSLCCASYNRQSLWFASPHGWSRFPPQSMVIFPIKPASFQRQCCAEYDGNSRVHILWCAGGVLPEVGGRVLLAQTCPDSTQCLSR